MITAEEFGRILPQGTKGEIMNMVRIAVTCCAMVIFAHGLFADDSASNEYVEVSSEGAAIRVETAGQTAFNVFAPMRDDSFVTNVFVSPVNDWTLAEPEESELPFEMGGGDSDSYTVEKSPEDSDVSGTIYFHNYWSSPIKPAMLK